MPETTLAEFIGTAVIIGLIVSIDVMGLEFSRQEPKTPGSSPVLSSTWKMALLHGATHAGAFFLYIAFILTVGSLALELPEFLANFLELLSSYLRLPFEFNFDVDGIKKALFSLISMGILFFVWETYREKIAENHKVKESAEGVKEELRWDALLLVELIGKTRKIKDLFPFLLAAAVAVDMLAVSALIRTRLVDSGNGRSLELCVFESLRPFFDPILLATIADAFIFACIILITVTGCAFVIRCFRIMLTNASNEPKYRFLWILRILEPIAIFMIMAEVIQVSMGTGQYEEVPFLEAFIFATVMTISLLVANKSLSWEVVKDGLNFEASGSMSTSGTKGVLSTFRKYRGGAIYAFVVGFTFIFVYCVGFDSAFGTGAIGALAASSTVAVSLAAVILFLPFSLFSNYEARRSRNLRNSVVRNDKRLWRKGEWLSTVIFHWLGAAIAWTTILLAVYRFGLFDTRIDALVVLGVAIFLTWFLLILRRCRLLNRPSKKWLGPFDYAEVVSSIGISLGLMTVLWLFVV